MSDQPDLLSPYRCAWCNRHGATVRFRAQGPDDSWECYRYWCSIDHHAKDTTNQPKPEQWR